MTAFKLPSVGSSGKLLPIRLHKYRGISVRYIDIPSILMQILQFMTLFDMQLNNRAYSIPFEKDVQWKWRIWN